jgi:hypothetical protein
MDQKSNHYLSRLLARAMDILLIGFLVRLMEVTFPSLQLNLLTWFVLYNLTAIILSGKTLGKYCFSLRVDGSKKGLQLIPNQVLREFLFLLLLPLLFINMICSAPLPLHDRISGTKVIKDES